VSSRSDLYLKEMGLGPRWRLRSQAPAESDPVVAVPAEVETDVAEKAAALPVAPAGEVVPPDSRRAAIMGMDWPALRADILACRACPLSATRIQAVPGVGAERADWLFVGEAPGADEDAQGEPFVGQAGKLLDAMLAAIGLKRDDNVYIANVLKCRPPGNRNPAAEEVACCEPYLRRQIELLQPKLIVALGKFAAQTLLAQDTPIARLRGSVHRYQGVPLIVTYHPAYLLRTLPDKAKAWQDLCLAVKSRRATEQAE